MAQGEQAAQDSETTASANGKTRVVCPLCGHQLFKISAVRNPNLSVFAIEIKCKASGCKRLLEVRYELGGHVVVPLKTVA